MMKTPYSGKPGTAFFSRQNVAGVQNAALLAWAGRFVFIDKY
jgi:hypothetical protein